MTSQPQPPVLTLAAIDRALSQQRFNAYRNPSDQDEVDALSRYLWNIGLVSTLQPSLHVFEVTLRNAIFTASVRLVEVSGLDMPDIPCWLDARNSPLLYPKEADKVVRARDALPRNPSQRTPGHLVAKLSLGFWVQLTARVYSETRMDGPRLWPRGLPAVFPFRWPPGSRRNAPTYADREMIYTRLHQVRELRNRISHHEPIWDRNPAAEYARLLEVLGWMNRKAAEAVSLFDAFPRMLAGGPEAFRPRAIRLLRGGTPFDHTSEVPR